MSFPGADHEKGRILAAALLLALAGTAQAQADTPEARRTAAKALVQVMDELTGPERMMGTMRAAVQGPLMQQFRTCTRP